MKSLPLTQQAILYKCVGFHDEIERNCTAPLRTVEDTLTRDFAHRFVHRTSRKAVNSSVIFTTFVVSPIFGILSKSLLSRGRASFSSCSKLFYHPSQPALLDFETTEKNLVDLHKINLHARLALFLFVVYNKND